jgi:hypothetical protein
LINFSTFDLTTRVRPDAAVLDESGIDTGEFISSVVPISGAGRVGDCGGEPTLADTDGDEVPDTFLSVYAGSRLSFDVTAQNETVPGTGEPQVFTAFIDVIQRGGAVLDTQVVTVLVPPDLKPVDP